MPFLLAALAVIAGAYFWMSRARNAAEMTGEILDMANDVRLAARRFGFRRQSNQHPVESIDDPNLAIGALACAFLELDDLPTADQRSAMDIALRKHLHLSGGESEELMVLGRWLVSESGGAGQAVPRLLKRLAKLGGQEAMQPLLRVVNDTLAAGDGGLGQRQTEALEDVRRAFGVR